MSRSKKKKLVGVLLTAAVLGVAGTVAAQAGLTIGGSRANFGVHRLSPGFMPDPRTVNVVSGGNVDASTLGLGQDCGGWVTRQPDAIIKLENGTSSNLRFFVRGANGGDTTLVINDASGRWHCNDDVQPGNLNPMVDIANAGPGQYDVWIGSYRDGEQIRGQLYVTELSSQRP